MEAGLKNESIKTIGKTDGEKRGQGLEEWRPAGEDSLTTSWDVCIGAGRVQHGIRGIARYNRVQQVQTASVRTNGSGLESFMQKAVVEGKEVTLSVEVRDAASQRTCARCS